MKKSKQANYHQQEDNIERPRIYALPMGEVKATAWAGLSKRERIAALCPSCDMEKRTERID